MVFKIPKIKRKRSGGEGEGSEHRSFSLVAPLMILLLCLLAVSLYFNFYQVKQRPTSQALAIEVKKALAEPREPADASSEISGHWYGLCPKNSIHTIADFKGIVENDPLLSKHFSGFKWDKARMGIHKGAIWTHLTFRKDEKIRTTKKVVKLPAGDGYITDGDRWVRTYCGNDYTIVNAPEPQPAMTERIDTDLNRLIDRADNSSRLKKSGIPGEEDPLVVPESSTVFLLGAGLCCLGLMSFYSLRPTKGRRRRVTHKKGTRD